MIAYGKQLIKLVIRILITTGLLLWVFSQIDLVQFQQTVKSARWQFLIAVWAVTVVAFYITSIKMQLILKKQGCSVSLNTLFGASAITLLYGMIMPGILSTGVKWYILKRNTGKGSKVLSSMVYNQLSIMYVMMASGLVALMILNPVSLFSAESKNQWVLPVVCGILLVAILSVVLFILNGRTGGKIINVLKFLLQPLPVNIRQKAFTLIDHIAMFQTVGARFHINIAFITIMANLICGVLLYILSALAANVTAPLAVLVCLCAVIYVLSLIPISIANLGVREVTLAGFLAIYGVEKSAALLMSMILFSTIVLMAIIGAMYQISWALSSKKTVPPQSESA